MAVKLSLRTGSHTVSVSLEGGLGLDALEDDALNATYGELLASILLGDYRVEAERGEELERLNEVARSYRVKVFVEELARLAKSLAGVEHRLRLPVTTPLLMRMRRLAKLYPWLRPAYNALLSSKPEELLRRALEAAREAGVGRVEGRLLLLGEGDAEALKRSSYPRGLRRGVEAIGRAITAALAQQLITPSALAEGLSVKPHPLLRDPLAGVRIGQVPVATLLVDFETQLYALTGVSRALRLVRAGGVRAAKKLVSEGFVTAVVKDYSSPIAAKWLVASILTLHLPRPILRARRRLLNEIEFTLRLSEMGFDVHEPILADPRRLRAAYRYVEGSDLASILKRVPVPPHYRSLGAILAQLHAKNVCLWDTNPSNFVVDRLGTIYLVDLEQAREAKTIEEMAWDVAMGLYYSAIYSPREAPSRAKTLVEGYLDAGGKLDVVLEAAKPKYMVPFVVAVAPTVLERTRKAILHAAGLGAASRDI